MASVKYYGTGRRKRVLPEYTLHQVQVRSQSTREISMNISVLKH
jgi:hypothetical protein